MRSGPQQGGCGKIAEPQSFWTTYLFGKERGAIMKKLVILMIVVMLTVFVSVATADSGGEKAGRLFLFQKCDASLVSKSGFDASGCPNVGTGPWPIFPNNDRVGELHYSLWGKNFDFSFQGHNLLPGKNYTLIYYPDPWPGKNLICLGSGQTTPASTNSGKNKQQKNQKSGNIQLHGSMDIATSLPASYDANFNPVSPSGAVGAKIWLVLSDDVECKTSPFQMINWNPTAYLFEYNLITYENQDIGEDIDVD